MNLKNILKGYRVSILLIIFGSVLEYLTFSTTTIPLWLIGIIVIIVGILQMVDKVYSSKEFSAAVSTLQTKFSSDVGALKKQSEEQKKLSEEQIKLITDIDKKMSEKQKTRIALVARLLEKGLISQSDVVKHLEGTDTFILYCYANPLPLPKYTPKGEKVFRRLYIPFLESSGFVRMPHSTFFIITADRLTKRLHNSETLKLWILKSLESKLNEEADAQLTSLNVKRRALINQEYGSGNYAKALNMNILIFRVRLNKGNIGIINKVIWPERLVKLLGSEVNLTEIKVEEERKIEVKKFVFESSFQLFFSGILRDDLKKLLKLEPRLKSELSINSLIDYNEKSVDDIKRVFKRSFDESKATEYANLVKSKARDYEDALKEMGISTAP